MSCVHDGPGKSYCTSASSSSSSSSLNITTLAGAAGGGIVVLLVVIVVIIRRRRQPVNYRFGNGKDMDEETFAAVIGHMEVEGSLRNRSMHSASQQPSVIEIVNTDQGKRKASVSFPVYTGQPVQFPTQDSVYHGVYDELYKFMFLDDNEQTGVLNNPLHRVYDYESVRKALESQHGYEYDDVQAAMQPFNATSMQNREYEYDIKPPQFSSPAGTFNDANAMQLHGQKSPNFGKDHTGPMTNPKTGKPEGDMNFGVEKANDRVYEYDGLSRVKQQVNQLTRSSPEVSNILIPKMKKSTDKSGEKEYLPSSAIGESKSKYNDGKNPLAEKRRRESVYEYDEVPKVMTGFVVSKASDKFDGVKSGTPQQKYRRDSVYEYDDIAKVRKDGMPKDKGSVDSPILPWKRDKKRVSRPLIDDLAAANKLVHDALGLDSVQLHNEVFKSNPVFEFDFVAFNAENDAKDQPLYQDIDVDDDHGYELEDEKEISPPMPQSQKTIVGAVVSPPPKITDTSMVAPPAIPTGTRRPSTLTPSTSTAQLEAQLIPGNRRPSVDVHTSILSSPGPQVPLSLHRPSLSSLSPTTSSSRFEPTTVPSSTRRPSTSMSSDTPPVPVGSRRPSSDVGFMMTPSTSSSKIDPMAPAVPLGNRRPSASVLSDMICDEAETASASRKQSSSFSAAAALLEPEVPRRMSLVLGALKDSPQNQTKYSQDVALSVPVEKTNEIYDSLLPLEQQEKDVYEKPNASPQEDDDELFVYDEMTHAIKRVSVIRKTEGSTEEIYQDSTQLLSNDPVVPSRKKSVHSVYDEIVEETALPAELAVEKPEPPSIVTLLTRIVAKKILTDKSAAEKVLKSGKNAQNKPLLVPQVNMDTFSSKDVVFGFHSDPASDILEQSFDEDNLMSSQHTQFLDRSLRSDSIYQSTQGHSSGSGDGDSVHPSAALQEESLYGSHSARSTDGYLRQDELPMTSAAIDSASLRRAVAAEFDVNDDEPARQMEYLDIASEAPDDAGIRIGTATTDRISGLGRGPRSMSAYSHITSTSSLTSVASIYRPLEEGLRRESVESVMTVFAPDHPLSIVDGTTSVPLWRRNAEEPMLEDENEHAPANIREHSTTPTTTTTAAVAALTAIPAPNNIQTMSHPAIVEARDDDLFAFNVIS